MSQKNHLVDSPENGEVFNTEAASGSHVSDTENSQAQEFQESEQSREQIKEELRQQLTQKPEKTYKNGEVSKEAESYTLRSYQDEATGSKLSEDDILDSILNTIEGDTAQGIPGNPNLLKPVTSKEVNEYKISPENASIKKESKTPYGIFVLTKGKYKGQKVILTHSARKEYTAPDNPDKKQERIETYGRVISLEDMPAIHLEKQNDVPENLAIVVKSSSIIQKASEIKKQRELLQ